MKPVLLLVFAALVVAIAAFMFRSAPSANPHDANGRCLLVADARIVESMGDLVVQPPNGEEWTDVTLTLRGEGTGGTNRGQSTGAFALTRPVLSGRTALKMETFQKPDGQRWVNLVMRPTDVEIVATHAGEQCRLAKSF